MNRSPMYPTSPMPCPIQRWLDLVISSRLELQLCTSRPDPAASWMTCTAAMGREMGTVEERLADVMGDFARTMLTEFSIQGILDQLVVHIVEVMPITAAGVTMIAPGEHPRFVAASSPFALRLEGLQSELAQGPCMTAYERGEAVEVPDLRAETLFPRFQPKALEAGLAAVFAFPLRNGRTQMGALDLYRDTPGGLDASAARAAQTLADVAAAYLLNAKARVDLEASLAKSIESSLHDPLTGLANRTLLVELLKRALLRNVRSDTLTAVLYCDIDQFKYVNDTFGHRLGDELLVEVAGRLRGIYRPSDGLARISGDEFAIVCDDLATRHEGEAIAKRAVHALGEPFLLTTQTVHLTASIGVAFAQSATTPEELLENADKAMYEAKRRGGGRHQVSDTAHGPGDLAHGVSTEVEAVAN